MIRHAGPTILMCEPRFYGIEYEINAWMDRSKGVDRELAVRQWTALRDTLAGPLGAAIELVEPTPGLPDQVFTANAGVVFGDRFVPSRFHPKERRGEEPVFAEWFRERGWRVEPLPSPEPFEGAGDALFCGDTLFAGYIHRSSVKSHGELGARLGCQTLSLELVDPRFYHLDTCFCPLAPGEALYYPGAFDDYGRRVLAENVPNLIAVDADDAACFGCNAVVVGRNVAHHAACRMLPEQLRAAGFTPFAVDLSEFLKAGGSAKCLTLRLDGEDAAGWRDAPGVGYDLKSGEANT